MTNATEAPRRFTAEQVLAVFETAGPFAAPMTTREVALAVRAANGVDLGRTDVLWFKDVAHPLADLVAAGKLVTSKAPKWSRGWVGSDEQHRHLITPGENIQRFYATPAQSEVWKDRLTTVSAEAERAELVSREIARTWNAPVTVVSDHAKRPTIQVTLTLDQAARLFGIGVEA